MKVQCDARGIGCELSVSGPTPLQEALPKRWRARRIDGRVYILCDICGNLRQFVGGLSPYLRERLNLTAGNVTVETPEHTHFPDHWFFSHSGDPAHGRIDVRPAGRRTRSGRASPMTDINTVITSGNLAGDPERTARAAEIAAWSRDKAIELARAEGLELSEPHFKVISFLQDHYVCHGRVAHARVLAAALDEHFTADGGRKTLYELFPRGPVTQGGRLAGVPVPADSQDRSFGTAY